MFVSGCYLKFTDKTCFLIAAQAAVVQQQEATATPSAEPEWCGVDNEKVSLHEEADPQYCKHAVCMARSGTSAPSTLSTHSRRRVIPKKWFSPEVHYCTRLVTPSSGDTVCSYAICSKCRISTSDLGAGRRRKRAPNTWNWSIFND